MPNRITDQERESILADFNAGESSASLARKYKHARDTISAICGLREKRPQKIDEEKQANILADYANGMRKYEIAKKHRLAKSTVGRICGITHPIKKRNSVTLAAIALEKANAPEKPTNLREAIAKLVEVLRQDGVTCFTLHLGTEVTCTLDMTFGE
jgi:Mor family transcriptional regulator